MEQGKNLLVRFLQTGELGKLKIGMSIDQALAYTGLPDDEEISIDDYVDELKTLNVSDNLDMLILAYENKCLQLGFWKDGLDLASIGIRPQFHRGMPLVFPNVFGDLFRTQIQSLDQDQLKRLVNQNRLECYRVLPSIEELSQVTVIWFKKTCMEIVFEIIGGTEYLMAVTKSAYELDRCARRQCEEYK